VARIEAQRAADAAALAGARMIASSGYTSSSGSFNQSDICQSSGPALLPQQTSRRKTILRRISGERKNQTREARNQEMKSAASR